MMESNNSTCIGTGHSPPTKKLQYGYRDTNESPPYVNTPGFNEEQSENTNNTSKITRVKSQSSSNKKRQRMAINMEKLKRVLYDKLGIEEIQELILKNNNGFEGDYKHTSNQLLVRQTPQRKISNHYQQFRIMMLNSNLPDDLRLGVNECRVSRKDEDADVESEVTDFASIYKLKGLLGVGAFGVVLLVTNRQTKEDSALKIINKSRLSVDAREFLRNESSILMTLNIESTDQTSKNRSLCSSSICQIDAGQNKIVKFKQIFDTPIYAVIEMEYIQGGLLKKLFKKPLVESEVNIIVKNILQGLRYIHDRGFMHRDLKPENIIMCSHLGTIETVPTYDLKIVDFGLSVQHKGGPISLQEQIDDKVGTLVYMAPEQASYQVYSKRIDLWALGIIMYQLMSQGQHPLYNKGQDSYYDYLGKLRAIAKEEHSENNPYLQWKYNTQFSELSKDFFSKLCAYPPSERYDAKMALQHPWITGISGEIPLTRKQNLRLHTSQYELKKAMRSVIFCAMVVNRKEDDQSSIVTIDRDYYKRVMETSQASDSSQASNSTAQDSQSTPIEALQPIPIIDNNKKPDDYLVLVGAYGATMRGVRKRDSSSIKKKKEQVVKQIRDNLAEQDTIEQVKSQSPSKIQTMRKRFIAKPDLFQLNSNTRLPLTKVIGGALFDTVPDIKPIVNCRDLQQAKTPQQTIQEMSNQQQQIEFIQQRIQESSQVHKRRQTDTIKDFTLNFPMPIKLIENSTQKTDQQRQPIFHQNSVNFLNQIQATAINNRVAIGQQQMHPNLERHLTSTTSIFSTDDHRKSIIVGSSTLGQRKLSQMLKLDEEDKISLPNEMHLHSPGHKSFARHDPVLPECKDFRVREADQGIVQEYIEPLKIRVVTPRTLTQTSRKGSLLFFGLDEENASPLIQDELLPINALEQRRPSRSIRKQHTSSYKQVGKKDSQSIMDPLKNNQALIPNCLYNSGSKVLQTLVTKQQKQYPGKETFNLLSSGQYQLAQPNGLQISSNGISNQALTQNNFNPNTSGIHFTRKSVIAQVQAATSNNYYRKGGPVSKTIVNYHQKKVDPYQYLHESLNLKGLLQQPAAFKRGRTGR